MKKLESPLRIRTPLLAFERVCRRTGPIRRTCLFDNESEQPKQLDIRYNFPEHSWVQLFADNAEAMSDGVSLLLPPGQTKLQVVMNTDSSNFPYDTFRGRIYFAETEAKRNGSPSVERWLEISFENIDELRDFNGFAAFDLGTSNSMISLYHLRRDAVAAMPWSPALEQETLEVPSAIFVRDLARFRKLADGSASIGRRALEEYGASPDHDPRSLRLSTKRLIGSKQVLAADAQGAGGYVDPVTILYMLARYVRERTQDHNDVKARLRRVIVTFPPTWDYRQVKRWKEIFERLGFAEEDLDMSLDEASAAGLFYIYQWTKSSDARNRLVQDLTHTWREVKDGDRTGDQYSLNLISFDFGGGTIDLAFIEVELTLLEDVIRLRLSLHGSDSLDYGGDQVTLAIFRVLKRRLAMALSDTERYAGHEREQEEENLARERASVASGLFLLPGETTFFGPMRVKDTVEQARGVIQERWEDLEKRMLYEELPRELEDAIDALVPTRFWHSAEEPLSARAKRNFGWLWDQAESLKRELFQEANRRSKEISLSCDDAEEIEGGFVLADVPAEICEVSQLAQRHGDARISLSIREIYACISDAVEQAVRRARRLAGDRRIDRVVLSGQSSWIPLVRRLFMRPRGEGGFGLPPSKIEFDEDNAKAAVCKGACLLPVMRDALVGFDVDIANFKANLLSEMFYKRQLGGHHTLFPSGPIDDLRSVEESPDPASFAQHLTVFSGSEGQLLGQFNFTETGDTLPPFESHARSSREKLAMEGPFPTYAEVEQLRTQDERYFRKLASHLRDWPERALIAWMERDAAPGSPERATYRYYLTRNRNLLAVRDQGEQGKRMFRLRIDDQHDEMVHPRQNPFSGVH